MQENNFEEERVENISPEEIQQLKSMIEERENY
jgi:hypothetical protein